MSVKALLMGATSSQMAIQIIIIEVAVTLEEDDRPQLLNGRW